MSLLSDNELLPASGTSGEAESLCERERVGRITKFAPIVVLVLFSVFALGVLTASRIEGYLASIRGHLLRLDAAEFRVTAPLSVESVAIPFRVESMAREPVTISGAVTTCGCLSVLPIPKTIAPGESVWMTAIVKLSSKQRGEVIEEVRLSLDSSGLPVRFRVAIERTGPMEPEKTQELKPVGSFRPTVSAMAAESRSVNAATRIRRLIGGVKRRVSRRRPPESCGSAVGQAIVDSEGN